MQLLIALLIGVLIAGQAGWSCGNPSTLILSLNCSKYVNSLEDTFHPYKLNGSETDYCIKCLCDKTGKEATCTEVKCPELDCKEVIQEEGKCCKSCDTSDQTFLLPGEHVAYCVVDGKLYTDLSLVPSVNTSDPCEVCHCCDGKILCKSILKACPKPRCDRSQVFWDTDSCCPKCPLDLNQPHKQAATCKQNGFTYQDGDVWNPYFPKFGVVDCLNCTCTNGSINCKKLPCPPVRACTEDDPIEDITFCCPKCNRITTSPTPTQITPTTLSVTTSAPTIMLIPDPPARQPCKNSPYKVYQSVNNSIDQIAIKSISNVDTYIWSTSSVMQNESYSPPQFDKDFLNVIFKYVGNTREGRLRKLEARFNTKRMKKNLKYCQVNCVAKVIKILKLCKRH